MDFFLAVIGIAVAAGLGYVAWVEWSKASTDQRWSMIETLVEAAEQTLQGEAGSTRFDWVMGRLQKRFPGLDIEEAQDLIESAVYRLRQRSGVIVVEQPQEDTSPDLDSDWFGGSGRHN
jgi:hypothetical protein